jgi:hypothetical protein
VVVEDEDDEEGRRTPLVGQTTDELAHHGEAPLLY